MMYQKYDLTVKDLTVLITLHENPLATYDELEVKLKKQMSRGNIHSIIKKLTLPDNRQLPYFHVVGLINLNNLGLEITNTFISADNESKLQKIEQICDLHPYTSYCARCFGDNNGLLVQFRNPQGTTELIKELLEIMQKENLIEGFNFLPINKLPLYTEQKLDFWNPETFRWTFNWQNWFNEGIFHTGSVHNEVDIRNSQEWLTQKDIAIIAELGYNARRKNTEIIETMKRRNEECVRKGENAKDYYEFTEQTFSRHILRVKEECISRYRLFLDPQCFDIATAVCIWGSGEKEALKILDLRLHANPIPFTSTFVVQENLLFWYLHLPMTHLSELLFYLRKILTNLHFNFIDYPRSHNYLIWPETFDESTTNWRKDRYFMIDDILNKLK